MSKRHMAFGLEPSPVKYRLRLARYPALAEAITKYMAEPENTSEKQRLLDVGVGHGRVFRYVQAKGVADRIEWHGIDIRRLPHEEVAGSKHYRIELANVEEGLPYDDNFFDVIVAEQILEHLYRPDLAVAEIYRVAKPNALIIIGVPVFPGPIPRLRNWYIRKFPKHFEKSGSGHLQTFSLTSIRSLLLRENQVIEEGVRGFRVASGGPLRPLENQRWWYRFNCWLGKKIPRYCAEVQFYLRSR